MDILSLFGLLLAVVAILGGQWLEGGHIASLLQVTAFLIVIGGTLGAVLLQHPLPVFAHGLRLARWAFQPPPCDYRALIRKSVTWSTIARKGGLLALESHINGAGGEYERKGLRLLIDGAEPEMLRSILEREIDTFEDSHRTAAKIWEAAGGYAPTVGILGAVMGLIHVMENLSDPSKLGSGIAVAFVATIYGVGSANLLFLPLAGKLKLLIAKEVKRREMLIDALICIANGENPRIVEGRLESYLADDE
ncbi:MAG: flagellar motor protein [Burkholderiales bacterium]|nr:flagellar motor protein [Burkholderiales bacterium]